MVSRLQISPKSRDLWDYWIHDKGHRWMNKPHPWTALRNALIKEGVPPHEANGLATNIMMATARGRALFKKGHSGHRSEEIVMNDDLLIRSFTPDLEIRAGGDGRTVSGIAVPYNKEQRINAHLVEVFRPGAFRAQVNAAHRVKFTREHMSHGGQLIGRATLLREDASGLYAEFRVSKTPLGDETLELIRDGVLTDLSIGFREGQNRSTNGVVERLSASLFEVSVVLQGAYGEAATIAAVRAIEDDEPTGTPHLDEARKLLRGLNPLLPIPGSLR